MPLDTIDDLLKDDRFKGLDPEDQQTAVMQFMARQDAKKAGDKMEAPPSRGGAALNVMDQNVPIPFVGDATLSQRLAGGGVGALQGAGIGATFAGAGSIPGAVMGGLLGGIFPPKTPGQWGAQLIAPEIGGPAAKLVDKVKNPALRASAAGISGLLNMLGLNTATAGIDAASNKALGTKYDVQNPLDVSAGQAAVAALPPIVGDQLLNRVTRNAPTAVSRDLIKGTIDPNAKLSDLPAYRTLTHDSPALASAVAAGQKLTPEQIANEILQKKTQAKIDAIDVKKAGLRTKGGELTVDKTVNNIEQAKRELDAKKAKFGIQPDIDELKVKGIQAQKGTQIDPTDVKIELLRKQQEQANAGVDADLGKVETKAANEQVNLEKRGNVDWKRNQLDEDKVVLKKQLDKLQEKATDLSNAMHSDLGILAKYENSDDLIHAIGGINPDGKPSGISAGGIAAFRDQALKEGGQKAVDALQRSSIQEFMRQAYDPATKTFSKGPALTEATQGNFSPRKLQEIFGGGTQGKQKTDTFLKMTDAISKSGEPSKGDKWLRYLGAHAIWTLPNMLVFHPGEFLQNAAVAGAASGVAYSSIKYPKLIEAALQSDKKWLGDSFYNWATGTTRAAKSLSNWPRLAAWMKANSEPVELPNE